MLRRTLVRRERLSATSSPGRTTSAKSDRFSPRRPTRRPHSSAESAEAAPTPHIIANRAGWAATATTHQRTASRSVRFVTYLSSRTGLSRTSWASWNGTDPFTFVCSARGPARRHGVQHHDRSPLSVKTCWHSTAVAPQFVQRAPCPVIDSTLRTVRRFRIGRGSRPPRRTGDRGSIRQVDRTGCPR